MPTRVIRLHTPAHIRMCRVLRIVWLRYRIRSASDDMRYLESDPWHDPAQIDLYRRQIGVWQVEILTLENQ